VKLSGQEKKVQARKAVCQTACVTMEAADGRSIPHVSLSGFALYQPHGSKSCIISSVGLQPTPIICFDTSGSA
jgi:hypothetical protein